jgi:hypothetical protein
MAESIVLLKALTPEARAALGGNFCQITRFPFRVGRESRSIINKGFAGSRRQTNPIPNNDLYLVETGTLINVSREHFLIDAQNDGYVLGTAGAPVEPWSKVRL